MNTFGTFYPPFHSGAPNMSMNDRRQQQSQRITSAIRQNKGGLASQFPISPWSFRFRQSDLISFSSFSLFFSSFLEEVFSSNGDNPPETIFIGEDDLGGMMPQENDDENEEDLDRSYEERRRRRGGLINNYWKK